MLQGPTKGTSFAADMGTSCTESFHTHVTASSATCTGQAALPVAARGCLRWVLDTAAWEPSQAQQQLLLELLPSEEQAAVKAYVRPSDRLHALASRLMARACVSHVMGSTLPLKDVKLQRTKGRKPFHVGQPNPAWAPNFNFSIGHEGRYTVLAAEPHLLVGVDVVAPQHLYSTAGGLPHAHQAHSAGMTADRLARFRSSLADSEWSLLQRASSQPADQAALFQRLWCLKESFVKARGDGLGFSPLSRAAFSFPVVNAGNQAATSKPPSVMTIEPVTSSSNSCSCSCAALLHGAQAAHSYPAAPNQLNPTHTSPELSCMDPCLHLVNIDTGGVAVSQQERWSFRLHDLPHGHVMAVARGPPYEAVDAYGVFRSTFQEPQLSPARLQQLLHAPAPPPQLLQLTDVLHLAGAHDLLQAYLQAAGPQP